MLTPGLLAPAKPAAASSCHTAPSKPAHKAFTALPVIDVSALLECSKSQVCGMFLLVSLLPVKPEELHRIDVALLWILGHTESPATGS